MKTVRLESPQNRDLPHSFKMLAKHLPSTMKAKRSYMGYGVYYHITAGDECIAEFWPKRWWGLRSAIVELKHPQYFSDIEDAIRKYESQSGEEVELRFWQAE